MVRLSAGGDQGEGGAGSAMIEGTSAPFAAALGQGRTGLEEVGGAASGRGQGGGVDETHRLARRLPGAQTGIELVADGQGPVGQAVGVGGAGQAGEGREARIHALATACTLAEGAVQRHEPFDDGVCHGLKSLALSL